MSERLSATIDHSNAAASEVKPALPSWQESAKQLSPEQHAMAEISFFQAFLTRCNDDAAGQLPWLRTKEQGSDKLLRTQHVVGLLDAYVSLPQGEEGRKKFVANWGEKSDYLEHRVAMFMPELEGERNKIFGEAKDWDSKDQKEETRKSRMFLAQLPKEQQAIFEERTNLPAEKLKEAAVRWGITIGTNVVSTYALDAVASGVGVGISRVSNQAADFIADHPRAMEGVPLAVLIPVLGASYAAWWYGGMRQNLEANWNLLQETGVSTNAVSKGLYEIARKRGASEKAQKRASKMGYVGFELAKEWPYYAAALGAAATKQVSIQDSIVFLAGANLGAAGYEALLAYGTNKRDKIKDFIRNRTRIKSSDNR